MYEATKAMGVNTGIISMYCNGENGVKSGISKTTGKRYTFKYG